MVFQDRSDAGKRLAAELSRYQNRPDVVVLALPGGGVPVACEIVRYLHSPLDVFVVRTLPVPRHEEVALGAIASGGIQVINELVMRLNPLSKRALVELLERETEELKRQEALYRGDRPNLELYEKTVILVDDGLTSGSAMRAAVEAILEHSPARLVVAVPVGACESCSEIEQVVDEFICLEMPEPFQAVCHCYENFDTPSDQEVRELLTIATSQLPTLVDCTDD